MWFSPIRGLLAQGCETTDHTLGSFNTHFEVKVSGLRILTISTLKPATRFQTPPPPHVPGFTVRAVNHVNPATSVNTNLTVCRSGSLCPQPSVGLFLHPFQGAGQATLF